MKGGDTPTSTKWMEDCVTSISGTNKRTGKPYTKGEKIAICKAQYDKKGSSAFEGEASIDPMIFEDISNYKTVYMAKVMKALNVGSETAEAMFDVHLARNDYDIVKAMTSRNSPFMK